MYSQTMKKQTSAEAAFRSKRGVLMTRHIDNIQDGCRSHRVTRCIARTAADTTTLLSVDSIASRGIRPVMAGPKAFSPLEWTTAKYRCMIPQRYLKAAKTHKSVQMPLLRVLCYLLTVRMAF